MNDSTSTVTDAPAKMAAGIDVPDQFTAGCPGPDGTVLPDPGTYVIDPAHSSIQVSTRHLVVSRVTGRAQRFHGSATITPDVRDSQVSATVDATSIDTGNADRDQHLRSDDFLAAQDHPHITFVATGVEHDPDAGWQLPGELTMRGVTRPVTVDLEYLGTVTDHTGTDRVVLRGSATLLREDWSMTWNQALEAGGLLVGRSLDVTLDVQLTELEIEP